MMSEHLLDRYVLLRFRVNAGSLTLSEEQVFEAARASNVRYVVSATLRPVGDDVSVRAQLATASGEQLVTTRLLASRNEFGDRIEQLVNRTLARFWPAVFRYEITCSEDLPFDSIGPWQLVARSVLQIAKDKRPNIETIELLRHAFAHSWLAAALYNRIQVRISSNVTEDSEEALIHANHSMRLNPYIGLETAALLHSSIGDKSLASAFVSRYQTSYGTLRSEGLLGALIHLGRAQEVVDVVGHDPQPSEYECLGQALEVIGDFEGAVIVRRKCIALAPDHYARWVQLANTLSHQNEREEALSAWENAKKLLPTLTLEDLESIVWLYPGQEEAMLGGLRRLGLD